MCTICGIATDEPDSSHHRAVLRMLEETRHRGPDACGIWSSAEQRTAHAPNPASLDEASRDMKVGRILLAQSRLTITGTDAAVQPFTSTNGALAFAHNGEIYNHEELRRLLPESLRDATGSDSEVLARLVEAQYEGDLAEAVRRTLALAEGMYAIAATDGATLVVARDAVGKKPVYYTEGPPFAFASERKAIAALAAASGSAVRRLLPGRMLVMKPGKAPVTEVVDRITVPPVDIMDLEEAVESYGDVLRLAIARRTRGLEKAAVLFSGGVDSVLVARLLQEAGLEVTGYTMGMDGSGDVDASEAYAREMGMNLKVARVDEDTLERELPAILRAAEHHGPLQAEVSVPMWFASRMAHEDGHRVIFTGQGADELFGGYDWYRKVVEKNGHLELLNRLWEDVNLLYEDTLEREDRITMAWSLELRAPFLDRDLMRVAMRISPEMKCRDGDDLMRKVPHREVAFRAGVPKTIAFREKVPAQDGASVHTLLDNLARRRFPEGVKDSIALPDFGSNYRYRDTLGEYGSPEVRALLDAVVREHGIAVVDQSGEIPRREVRVPVAAVAANPVKR